MEKTKKVYIVAVESFWDNSEEYYDVLDVFKHRNDAIKALKEYKDDFIKNHSEDIAEVDVENRNITDTDTHYQFLDEGMGWNYELFIIEKELK